MLLRIQCFLSVLSVLALMMHPIATAEEPLPKTIRIATYNASLYGKKAGEIRERLADGRDQHAENIAGVVQTIRPDILLINEIDHDSESAIAKMLAEKFFAVDRGGRKGIDYPFVYSAPSNTGLDSKRDLNRNDRNGEPNDAWGYGLYPGQFAMAVFSRFPIDDANIRSFMKFRWSDLPGALRPIDPKTDASYYDDATWSELRLSSKNHLDVPIRIGDTTVHLLASHPTPPVFDGDEDRNGCRNHDEIRFWVDYLEGERAKHLEDDSGSAGGLPRSAAFVIMGDLNADPSDGDGRRQAIQSLLGHDRVTDPQPASGGAVEASNRQSAGARQQGDPKHDTADFGRNGNMRVDYVLPSRTLALKDCGVFWPLRHDADRSLISSSDHRMVWIEVATPEADQ